MSLTLVLLCTSAGEGTLVVHAKVDTLALNDTKEALTKAVINESRGKDRE